MSFVLSTGQPPFISGNSATTLDLLEARVQTQLLMQILNGPDNNVQQLRNDEAPVLGVATPVPTA